MLSLTRSGGVAAASLGTLLLLLPALVRAADPPLTEEQLIQMSTTTLKELPAEVVKYVNQRGVTFFPTNTTLKWLERAGVNPSVISEIRRKAASQMRIKVCRFVCEDNAMATRFEEIMVRRLIDAKTGQIEPFGQIPLDRTPCPTQGFDSSVRPEANTFYILVQGWVRRTPTGFSLDSQVIYQDPTGKQHPLPDAENAPKSFTAQTVDDAAGAVVDWAIRTAAKFAMT